MHDELKDKVLILHNSFIEEDKQPYYLLTFETDLDTDIIDASNLITLHLCEVINNLSVRSRQLWNQCDRKVFDYGYQSGLTPWSLNDNLSHHAISEIAKLGGSIATTIYSYTEQNE